MTSGDARADRARPAPPEMRRPAAASPPEPAAWDPRVLRFLLGLVGRMPPGARVARLGPLALVHPGLRRAFEANRGLLENAGCAAPAARAMARSYVASRWAVLRILAGRAPEAAVHGLGHLTGALRAGRGALLVTAHVGCGELGCVGLAKIGPVHSVAGVQMLGSWTPALRRRFLRAGLRLHPSRGLRGLESALRRGEIVALQIDGDQGRRRAAAPFLGAPRPLPVGPTWLAARTGACVLPAACVREGSSWTIHLLPALPAPGTGREGFLRHHRSVVEAVEAMILRWPGQWVLPSSVAGLAREPGRRPLPIAT